MSKARFVELPRDAVLAELEAIGAAVRSAGGSMEQGKHGGEVVVDFVPPGACCMVRVFTSIAVGATKARASGEDAVRVVVCVRTPQGIRMLEPPIKVLRTAPRSMPDSERVATFLGRLRDRTRDAYRLAVRRPSCPHCGRAMARRTAKAGGAPFLGCIGFPECTGTRPLEG